MKYPLFGKKKKTLSKQEIIKFFKVFNEKFWPIRTIFTVSLLFCLDLTLIWFFTSRCSLSVLVPWGLLYGLIHLVLILELLDYKAIKNFEDVPEKEAYEIAKEFISYIETKGKGGTKRVKNMVKKIKIQRFYSKTYNIFYIVNFISAGLIFEFLTLYTINFIGLYFFGNTELNPEPISNLFVFGLTMYIYFSVVFLIDYKNSRNIRRVENLLEIAFLKDLNNCIDAIKKSLSENIENINIENLINLFNQWYTYYLGNYFEKKELNNILFDLHDIYVNLKYEEYFYNLFLEVKIKFQDEIISINNSRKEKIDSKYDLLISKIDNYLNLLDHKVKVKVKDKQEKDRKWRYFTSLITITGTLIAIFSTIFFS